MHSWHGPQFTVALPAWICERCKRTDRMKGAFLNAILAGLFSLTALAQPDAVVKEIVPCVVQDKQTAANPAATHLNGFLGVRLDANVSNRLVKIDEDRLLEGFRQRPGRQ